MKKNWKKGLVCSLFLALFSVCLTRVQALDWKETLATSEELTDRSYHCPSFPHSAASGGAVSPDEVQIHSYNDGTADVVVRNFYASVPLVGGLRQRVAEQLGVAEAQLAQRLTLVIQKNPELFWGNNGEQVLLRPQWAYARHYTGATLESHVVGQVRVFNQDGTSRHFGFSEGVSLHPAAGAAGMAISPNNLPLGFTNTDVQTGATKVVLSNVNFMNGPIQGEIKTTMTFVLSPEVCGEFECLCSGNLSVGEIFQALYLDEKISQDVLRTLELA